MVVERNTAQSISMGTSVSDPYFRYHIVAHRNLFFDAVLDQSKNTEITLHRTNRIKEARGLMKQEMDSHISMLGHHDYFDLHFDLEVSEDSMVASGKDDAGILRYQYIVRVRDNA